MVKERYINMDLSEEILNKLEDKETVKINQCYANVFENLIEVSNILENLGFNAKDLNIGYCYWQLSEFLPLYCRHCVYIIGDDIIDLTALKYRDKKNGDKLKYYTFARFTINECVSILDENNGYVDLRNHKQEFDEYNKIVHYDKWFKLIEDDYFNYVLK